MCISDAEREVADRCLVGRAAIGEPPVGAKDANAQLIADAGWVVDIDRPAQAIGTGIAVAPVIGLDVAGDAAAVRQIDHKVGRADRTSRRERGFDPDARQVRQ